MSSSVISSTLHSFLWVWRLFFLCFYFIFILFFLGRLLVLYFSLLAPAICYLFFLHVVCCMCSWQISNDDDDGEKDYNTGTREHKAWWNRVKSDELLVDESLSRMFIIDCKKKTVFGFKFNGCPGNLVIFRIYLSHAIYKSSAVAELAAHCCTTPIEKKHMEAASVFGGKCGRNARSWLPNLESYGWIFVADS